MKAKILVVEDEVIIAQAIKKDLENLGYIVTGTASSGKEAIEKASVNIPDLVLIDIVLKGNMDGIETAHKLINSYNVPVIYLTAYSDQETLKRAAITEPYGYIIKPFNESEIKANVEIALYKSKAEKERKENIKNKLMDDYHNFIANSLHDSKFNSQEEIKIGLGKAFENSFNKKMQKKFKKEINEENLSLYDDDAVTLFDFYIKWISKLFNDFGVKNEVLNENNTWKLVFYNCPWIRQANKNPLFCINCDAMVKRSFKWLNFEGKIEKPSKIALGFDKCSYRFIDAD